MAKIFLTFFLLVVIFYFSINAVRALNKKEKWALTKTVGYAILCASLAVLAMISIVILF